MKKSIVLFLLLIGFNILSKAQSNGSHEISASEKAEVIRVLDEYMNTFNAKDLAKWESTYQFPHFRLASGSMNVLEKAGLRDSLHVFAPLQKAGWDYSRWDHRNIIQAPAIKYTSIRDSPATGKMVAKSARMNHST